MFGKPHLDVNAHVFASVRTMTDMQQIADDKSLPDLHRQLARQCRDIAATLMKQLKESSHGQS